MRTNPIWLADWSAAWLHLVDSLPAHCHSRIAIITRLAGASVVIYVMRRVAAAPVSAFKALHIYNRCPLSTWHPKFIGRYVRVPKLFWKHSTDRAQCISQIIETYGSVSNGPGGISNLRSTRHNSGKIRLSTVLWNNAFEFSFDLSNSKYTCLSLSLVSCVQQKSLLERISLQIPLKCLQQKAVSPSGHNIIKSCITLLHRMGWWMNKSGVRLWWIKNNKSCSSREWRVLQSALMPQRVWDGEWI